MIHRPTRRKFLQGATAASVGYWIGGRSTWADELALKSPNERINIASIGIGGKGDGDSDQAAKYGNLIAICDIDEHRLAQKGAKYPRAERYTDFRDMLDEMGPQIDAVTVSTPDHTHAVATMMAIRMGKHVYTQKPMTHDVWEARQLRLAAARHQVSTQMGNQGTSSDRFREGVEVIQAGLIGTVREFHVWTDRPTNWWPQSPEIKARPPEAPVPSYVQWDQWLGTAPNRPYGAKFYHPRNWRGWWDFGCGALGDMGCHTANLPFLALKLGYPTSVQAESEKLNPETYPAWARIVYEFPERTGLPAVKMYWYEGHQDGKVVQPPQELIDKVVTEYNKVLVSRGDKRVADGKKVGLAIGGSITVGDKGILYSPTDDGKEWELLPAEDYYIYKAPSQTLPRNPLGATSKTMDEAHKLEWLGALKGGPKPMSSFDYAGLLTETILLGNVAIRNGGKKLLWDGPGLKFSNAPEADQCLRRQYREPWSL